MYMDDFKDFKDAVCYSIIASAFVIGMTIIGGAQMIVSALDCDRPCCQTSEGE